MLVLTHAYMVSYCYSLMVMPTETVLATLAHAVFIIHLEAAGVGCSGCHKDMFSG